MAKTKKKKKKSNNEPGQGRRIFSILLLMLVCFAGGFAASLKLQGVDPLGLKQSSPPVATPTQNVAQVQAPELSSEPRTLHTETPPEQPTPSPAEAKPVEQPEPQEKPEQEKPSQQTAAVPAPKPTAQPVPAPSPVAVAPAPKPSPVANSGRVAIIIDDCGNAPNSGFIALPAPITLAVLPHVSHAHAVAQQGAAAGKDVILHLPMEASVDSDPGPGTLHVAMSDQDLRQQVADNFAAVPGIIGVNNHQGSKASADRRIMQEVLAEASRRGLFYLDSRTTSATVAPEMAAAAGVRFLSRDVFLDNVDTTEAVLAQLRAAEEVARRQGSALAIGHPRPNTLKALQTWIPQAEANGFQLVRLSDLLAEEKTYAQAR